MTWQLRQILQADVKTIWPIVAPMLARGVYYSAGRTDMQAVYEALQTSMQLLWVAYDDADNQIAAAFTTRVAKYQKHSALVIDCVGGTGMRNWLRIASETFRSYARDAGLLNVEMFGRPGWARVLKSCGWAQKLVVLEIGAAAPVGDL